MSIARHMDIPPFTRRGACPALSAPMQTGDGLLSRIAFTDRFSPQALEALCALAIRHGNGLVDMTARGGLQIRGLMAQSAAALEGDVRLLDLPLRQGLAVETSPLAGFDQSAIADPRPVVRCICERAGALQLHARLAAKTSVIVDGGGQVRMTDLLADIRLKALVIDGDRLWQLMLGGTEATSLHAGVLRTDEAADCVIDLLSCLAGRGADARGRDFDLATVRSICAGRLMERRIDEQPAAVAPPYGLMRLSKDLFAAVLAPAFGQVSANILSAVCRRASELAMEWVRPGPAHGLFFFGSKDACQALLAYAYKSGFVTGCNDPRSAVAACPGAPACSSAFMSTHELADHMVAECAALLDGSFMLHLSGCGKGCAHPAPTPLAFSGRAEGLAFSFSGRVSDVPDLVLPLATQKAAFSRLARLCEKEHKPGENARALLARLGKDRIVAALRQEDR